VAAGGESQSSPSSCVTAPHPNSFPLTVPPPPSNASTTSNSWKPLPENDSPDKYAATIDSFFRATLRCHTGHPSGYAIPLTKVQAAEADKLLRSLLDDGCKIEEILDPLHSFSLSLLSPQPEGPEAEGDNPVGCQGWTCPVRCYLAAQGVREDGNFVPPEVLTPQLARFKYFCKTSALIQAYQMRGSTPGGMIP
jgi:hypothetical protein